MSDSRLVAVVMDPMASVNVATDTSFALMLEASRRDFGVVHVAPKDISLQGDRVSLRGQRVEVRDDQSSPFTFLDWATLQARDFAAIFIRTDPPFDEAYLNATWLLSFAVREGVRVVNDPQGIRNANEKLYALQFADLSPETLVTASKSEMQEFLTSMGGEAVAKPLDGHGGFGVLRLRQGDSNINAIIDVLSAEGARPMIVQRYLPEARRGDKRLFLINGELRGVLQRTPAADDHRGNVHVGGSTSAADIDANDRLIAERMGPQLRADGLLFVGLDVIAGKLIEVNVTSPTLIRELARHGGPDLAKEVMDAALGVRRT